MEDDELRSLDLQALERWGLGILLDFYRSQGRDEEAAPYEERLAELAPSSTAPIA